MPMTATQTLPMTVRDDIRLLAWDLACASGTLSEIATTWRRSWQDMPGLPLGLPLRLQDTARQLAADARSLGEADPEPGQAAFLVGQLAALSAQAAVARTVTCGPGSPGIGDALLWESLTAALRRAATRLRAAPPLSGLTAVSRLIVARSLGGLQSVV
jgi:hypothetical protein